MAKLQENSTIMKSTGEEVIATKEDLDKKISPKADKTYVDNKVKPKADKTYVDGNFATKEELSKAGKVQSVNNKTGNVVLTKSDIGLGNVDNVKQATKADLDKKFDKTGGTISGKTTVNNNLEVKSELGIGKPEASSFDARNKFKYNSSTGKLELWRKTNTNKWVLSVEFPQRNTGSGFRVEGEAIPTIKTGTFTPYIFGQGTKGSNSYSYREGRYMTIGDLVIISMRIRLSSKDSKMSGVLNIGGLPYKTSFYSALTVAQSRGIKTSYGTEVTATVNQMSDYPDAIYLYKHSYSDADRQNVYAEDITSNFGVYITGMYFK